MRSSQVSGHSLPSVQCSLRSLSGQEPPPQSRPTPHDVITLRVFRVAETCQIQTQNECVSEAPRRERIPLRDMKTPTWLGRASGGVSDSVPFPTEVSGVSRIRERRRNDFPLLFTPPFYRTNHSWWQRKRRSPKKRDKIFWKIKLY